jgi:hypothetical protein
MKPKFQCIIGLIFYLAYLKQTSPIRYWSVSSMLTLYDGSLEDLWNLCLQRQSSSPSITRANELRNWSMNYY